MMDEKFNSNDIRAYLFVSLFYAVLVLVFFYPVLQGMLISQSAYVHEISPWDTIKPTLPDAAINPFLQDQSIAFLPFFLEAKQQFSQGIFPLWNPYILAGNPLWANTQSALLYPLNLFHYLLPAPYGFTVISLLKLFIACLMMHLFVRQLKVGHGPALLAGVAFGFCSFNVFWLNHPHTNVTPLIPLCFYMVEKLLHQPSTRTKIWFALVVSLTLLAGHVEIAFLTATVCGVYFLLRLIQLRQLSYQALLSFLGIYIFGLLLAAVLIFPFIEFLFHTPIWAERVGKSQFSIPTTGLISLFFGEFFRFDGWNPRDIGYHSLNPYVGFVMLPLAMYAVIGAFRKIWPLIVVSVFALSVAFTVNPIHWLIHKLPLFNHLPLFYFNVLLAFGVAVLGAVGLQFCMTRAHNSQRLWVLLVVMVAVWSFLKFMWQPGGLANYTADASLLLQSVQAVLPWLALSLVVIWLLMFLAAYKPTLTVAVFLLIAFGDLWNIGHDWNPVTKPAQALPIKSPKALQFLQQQTEPFRIVGHNRIFKPSSNMLAGLHDVRGYDVPVIDRYHEFFRSALKGQDSFWYYDLPKFDAATLPYLSILNTAYILTEKAIAEPLPEPLELVYEDEITIYKNNQAMGLAAVFTDIKQVKSKSEALATVLANPENLSDLLIVESEEDLELSAYEPGNEGAEITYQKIDSQTIDLSVTSETDAWLVLSQSHYPGWKAYVNGKQTQIFVANYVLQAIKIPRGSHDVSFKYRPLSFTLGWLVSLLSLIIAVWKIKTTK